MDFWIPKAFQMGVMFLRNLVSISKRHLLNMQHTRIQTLSCSWPQFICLQSTLEVVFSVTPCLRHTHNKHRNTSDPRAFCCHCRKIPQSDLRQRAQEASAPLDKTFPRNYGNRRSGSYDYELVLKSTTMSKLPRQTMSLKRVSLFTR